MPVKPSMNNCGDTTSLVNRHLGTAYDNVRIVAEHIEEVITMSEGIEPFSLYLGAFTAPPTEGWNGEPLQSGNFYLNTTTNTADYYDADDMIWISVDSETVVQAAQTAVAARDNAQLSETNAAQSAVDAQEAADSIGRYQGLWPDTGGSALKGETWQTQSGGTPTGDYYTALQNTTVDPVGDNVNWRAIPSTYTDNRISDVGVSATINLDVTQGSVFPITLQEETTTINLNATDTNPTAAIQCILVLQQGTGSNKVTWPANIRWPTSSAPHLSYEKDKVDTVAFFSIDEGATWFAFISASGF